MAKETSSPTAGMARPPAPVRKHFVSEMEFVPHVEEVTLWSDVYYCSTEWDAYPEIFRHPWTFPAMMEAFNDGTNDQPKGDLLDKLSKHKYMYIWGTTEPKTFQVAAEDAARFESEGSVRVKHVEGSSTKTVVVNVPVIFVAVSDVALPDEVGVGSVTMEDGKDRTLPMKALRMAWTPTALDELQEDKLYSGRAADGSEHNLYLLSCFMRDSAIKHLPEERKAVYSYASPFAFIPKVARVEAENLATLNPFVEFEVEVAGKTYKTGFDLETDGKDPRVWINEFITSNDLPQTVEIGKEVAAAVKPLIGAERKRRAAMVADAKAKIEAIPEKRAQALDAIAVHKFYPECKGLEITKEMTNSVVSRYFPNAVTINNESVE